MDFKKFKHLFHESWHTKIQPFIESEDCDKIYAYLKSESKRGKIIAPLSVNVYRCFLETPLDKVKVVILGMCPYHTMVNGVAVADGLALGCSITGRLQPSLQQFYDAIERELYDGVCLDADKTANLVFLSEQGVLLMNAALTTEINKAGSHLSIWEPFTKYVFENILADRGLPIIYLGKEASKFSRYSGLFPQDFIVSHPASAAYSNSDWDSEGVFKKVNALIKETNNYGLNWLNSSPF